MVGRGRSTGPEPSVRSPDKVVTFDIAPILQSGSRHRKNEFDRKP
jgi:hypothetical protein